MDALGRRLGWIAKITKTRGIVYWCHQRAQWEYEARSRYWIWIGEYSSYVINVFSLAVPCPTSSSNFFHKKLILRLCLHYNGWPFASIRYSMNTHPIWLHFKDLRGTANRSVTEESRRNHRPYVWTESLSHAGAIIKWKPWIKLHFLFKTHRSKEIQNGSLYSYRCLELDHWWQTPIQVASSTQRRFPPF